MPDDAIVIAEGGDKTEVADMNIPDTTLDVARTMMGVPDVTPTPTKPTEPKVEEPVKKEPVKPVEVDDPAKKKSEDDGIPDVPVELLQKSKPVVKTDDDFDPNKLDLEQIDEKLRPNFAKMRDKLNGTVKDLESITQERDTLKTQLEKVPAADAETWAKEKTQLLDTISSISLERDPRFIQKYNTQLQPIVQNLKAAIESYNVEGLDADAAIRFAAGLSARERAEYLSGQLPSEIQQTALTILLPAFSQLDMVQRTRLAELADHKVVAEGIKKQSTVESQQKLAQLRTEAKIETVKKLAQDEMLLQKVEGNDKWNSAVDKVQGSIDAIFKVDDPKVHAEALALSRLTPIYKLMYLKEQSLRGQLEQAIKDRNISLPNLDASSPTSTKLSMKVSDLTPDSVAAMVASSL